MDPKAITSVLTKEVNRWRRRQLETAERGSLGKSTDSPRTGRDSAALVMPPWASGLLFEAVLVLVSFGNLSEQP